MPKSLIPINKESSEPKYMQIVHSVIQSIEKGRLKRGTQLPSITELAYEHQLAKATVAKAYEQLRQMGVIVSQHGKGFYVAKSNVRSKLNIFILFDTLNAYKEVLYSSLKAALPPETQFSTFFYHYDKRIFTSLIEDNLGKFNFYIIMPHFDEDVSAIVNKIPRDKLLLLDKDVPQLKHAYAAVFQDFEMDIQAALRAALPNLKKYQKLNLVLGKEHFQYVPGGLISGFKRFCRESCIASTILDKLGSAEIRKAEAYLVFSDSDMIDFIKQVVRSKWVLGKDIGLISYDDTPLKEILMGGVTVISTDFEHMGRKAGKMIGANSMEKVANPSQLILRKTL